MFCRVFGGSCTGIEGRIVRIEADAGGGLPSLHILGEISSEIREAGPRIRTAIKNSGFSMPPKRYLVNLAPAGFRKTGTGFDLPAAIALLCCIEQISPELLGNSIFIGELSLNGTLIPVRGILPVVERAIKEGFKQCFVPAANLREALILSGIEVYGVECLKQVIDHLQGIHLLKAESLLIEETPPPSKEFRLDFSEIRGQALGKRCVEIAAAGWHHLLMVGPPGSGKTMMAERIPGVMPPMSREEQMEVTKIYSSAGRLKPEDGQILERPFRRPHHSISDKALIGGGAVPTAGEMSLAHAGSLITAELGLEQGKEVYALPGLFNSRMSRGCHQLIQSGAKLVFRPEDIAEDYESGLSTISKASEKIKLPLDNSEQLVYASLSLMPKDVNQISAECGRPVEEVMRILLNLELKNEARQIGKNLYIQRL